MAISEKFTGGPRHCETLIRPGSEGPFENLDPRPNNSRNVETQSTTMIIRIKPRQRSSPNEALFPCIDRLDRCTETVAAAGLHLTEHDHITTHQDQVELTAPDRPILNQHGVTRRLIAPRHAAFAPPTKRNSRCVVPFLRHAPESRTRV